MINSAYTPPLDLIRRPRRNRQSAAIRALVRENHVRVDDLIQPLFIKDGNGLPEEIASLPGQSRLNLRNAITEVQELAALGIKAVALFPQIDAGLKDARGKYATIPKNWFFAAIREIKEAVPQVLVVADVALDPYTSHGHDGVLDANGDVANDETVQILTHYATLLAEAGADIVAPSDMMDGRIGAIRDELDHEGHTQTAILAYAVKFASAYYGPFRDAVGSATKKGAAPLDKRTYQLDPANLREALLEARLDEDQGADIIMVKPAGLYLDVINAVKAGTVLPVAAYQVSGEYAQIHAAARAGWLDLEKARDESLLAIKRAGADIILTYFAKAVAQSLKMH
ncbi:MAG TPA: porphobilinogen synthase [Candidatus Methylacidiphilales bacterium]|jgi:porphobilinogen synthase|nr:porphobilinogen synthase [Candidatus Methylacidiphilales bacterium]